MCYRSLLPLLNCNKMIQNKLTTRLDKAHILITRTKSLQQPLNIVVNLLLLMNLEVKTLSWCRKLIFLADRQKLRYIFGLRTTYITYQVDMFCSDSISLSTVSPAFRRWRVQWHCSSCTKDITPLFSLGIRLLYTTDKVVHSYITWSMARIWSFKS